MNRALRLLAVVLLWLGCSTATAPKDLRMKTYLELTTFVFEDKVENYVVTLSDTLSGSRMYIEFRSDGTLQGKGLLGFDRWPGFVTPDSIPLRYWIYGECVDTSCEVVVPRNISGWYTLEPTGEVKLYLKKDEGAETWLVQIPFVYNEETQTLGFYYEDEYERVILEFTVQKGS